MVDFYKKVGIKSETHFIVLKAPKTVFIWVLFLV